MLPSWHDVRGHPATDQPHSLAETRRDLTAARDFLRWACGIARNEVRNFQRRQAARRMVFSEELINSLAVVRLDAQPLLEKRRAMLAACAEKLDSTARKLFEMLLFRCVYDPVRRPPVSPLSKCGLSAFAANLARADGVHRRGHGGRGRDMSREPVTLPPTDSELARLVESVCDGTIEPAGPTA